MEIIRQLSGQLKHFLTGGLPKLDRARSQQLALTGWAWHRSRYTMLKPRFHAAVSSSHCLWPPVHSFATAPTSRSKSWRFASSWPSSSGNGPGRLCAYWTGSSGLFYERVGLAGKTCF